MPAVPLQRLAQQKYAQILCYPKPTKAEVNRRLEELKRLNVEAVSFRGPKQLLNTHVLGKGCVGIVVLAQTKGKRAALKIRRVDADRSTMHNEARMLNKANVIHVGPKLLAVSKNFLLTQYINGQTLQEWLSQDRTRKEEHNVLSQILEQCWRLDQTGLDHGELSYAAKHVLITKSKKPVIVDFETASTNRGSSNVTSICQYLFLSHTQGKPPISDGQRKAIIEALKRYKRNRSRENYERVLHVCGLDHVGNRSF